MGDRLRSRVDFLIDREELIAELLFPGIGVDPAGAVRLAGDP